MTVRVVARVSGRLTTRFAFRNQFAKPFSDA